MAPRVALNAINKRYNSGKNSVVALQSITLTLRAGEFLAIAGPSGSGKSSLLNICGLIDTPSSGHYQLDGIHLEQLNQHQRCSFRRHHIGFIFQRHQLIPAMTVFENIAYPLYLNGYTPKQINSKVNTMMKKIGLAQRHNHLPQQLSGGECQRVGIARALIKNPKLIIADEPSASLDHTHTHASLQLMRELNREHGASVIIASHDPAVIEQCDRKVSLLDGKQVDQNE